MRGVVLRRDHALSYSAYISITLVNIVINVAVATLIALIWLFDSAAVSSSLGAAILAGVLLGSALVLLLPSLPLPKGQGLAVQQLRSLAQGIVMIRGDGRAIFVLAGIAAGKVAVNALRMSVCFQALGQVLGIAEAGLLGAVQTLSVVVNITPGNLGLREMMVSLVSTGLGTAYWVGLAATSIDRVVSLAYTMASGLPGLHMLRQRRIAAVRLAGSVDSAGAKARTTKSGVK
jgi:hypothetical protein